MPRRWLASVALAFLLIAACEGVARILLAPIGDRAWAYWDDEAVDKFEWYRAMAERGEAPDIVVIGDSTGALNIDPKSLSAGAGGTPSYNLAWPANFPMTWPAVTFPLFDAYEAPRVVVLAAFPDTFVESAYVIRNERSILESPIARRQRGLFNYADVVWLCRLYPARHLLMRHWLARRPLIKPPEGLGFMPANDRPARGNDWESVTEVPAFSAERRAVVLDLVAQAQARGFHVVIPVGPYRVAPPPPLVGEHLAWLRGVEAAAPDVVTVLDMTEVAALSDQDFKDGLHLWEGGARTFSRVLGEEIARSVLPRLAPAGAE